MALRLRRALSLVAGAGRRGPSTASSASSSSSPSASAAAEAEQHRSSSAQRLFAVRSSLESAAGALEASLELLSASPRKLAALRALHARGLDPLAALPQPASLAHLKKAPRESLLRVRLPFRSDPRLRAQYVNKWGMLRVGKLLEELDSFAGSVAYAFVDDADPATSPPTLVTASFDRLDLLQSPLRADVDLQLEGMVTYAGASSFNIDIDLTTVPEEGGGAGAGAGAGGPEPAASVLQASTTFVARSRDNKRAVPVPRLDLENASDAERALHEAGRRATEARRAARSASLARQPPTAEELAMIHALFVETQGQGALRGREGAHGGPLALALARDNAVFADETALATNLISFPQDRNLHGKVFGGFLMRQAFEIAWAAGWRATGELPKFLALDDVVFLAPVETGALLTFEAHVSYARGAPSRAYAVTVEAKMSVPDRQSAARHHGGSGGGGSAGGGGASAPTAATAAAGAAAGAPAAAGPQHKLTNTFSFVFYADDANAVPRVYPRTYVSMRAAAHPSGGRLPSHRAPNTSLRFGRRRTPWRTLTDTDVCARARRSRRLARSSTAR
jgi:acyl-coenzyme A thioesterase 9